MTVMYGIQCITPAVDSCANSLVVYNYKLSYLLEFNLPSRLFAHVQWKRIPRYVVDHNT